MYNREYYEEKKQKLVQKLEKAKNTAFEAHLKVTVDFLNLQKEIQDDYVEIEKLEKEQNAAVAPEAAPEVQVEEAGESKSEQTTVADETAWR